MHSIHKVADNPEANAEAALLAPGHRALEGTEDASLVFLRDADSVILNSQSRRGAVTSQRDPDRLARAIFDGVRQEVIGDLLDSQFIEQPGYLAFNARFQAATRALRTRPMPVHGLSHHCGEIDHRKFGAKLSRVNARDVQKGRRSLDVFAYQARQALQPDDDALG